MRSSSVTGLREIEDVSLSAIVVDDEPLAREGLAAMLADDFSVVVSAVCSTGEAAVAAIERHRPDIAFLDIEMPGMSGFDVIHSIGVDQMPFVIFTTAYEKYAIDAFAANAIEYLLKPYSETQLAAAVSRARRAVHEHRLAELATNLLAAVGGVPELQKQRADAESQRIAVRNADNVSFVPIRDIDWIEGADYYAKLHVAGRAHLVRESLTSLAKRLESARFLRIHRSAIVNVDRVREIRSLSDGDSVAVLASGARVPLARGNRRELERLLQKG